MKKKNNSISKKIFTITFSLIILLLGASFLLQYFFFDNFYASKKTKNLILSVNKFKLLYSKMSSDNDTLYKAMNSFEMINNAKIAIYSTNGEIRYITNNDNENSETSKLLNDIFQTLYNNKYYAELLAKSNETYTTTFEDPKTNMKHIVCFSSMSLNYKNDSIIIAITSYQQIKEASSAILELYSYVGMAFAILGLVLSLIYSNMISKPLISINNVAKKMSSMNFEEKCPVESDDEIGNLAKTLNFLSNNLSRALEDLKLKNKKLKADIEKERQLEKLRKDFIAGASHELKTPIGIIEGYAEGLKDNIVEGEARDFYLDVIIDESQKMNKLVMDMLELSKLESANNSFNFEKFNFKELLLDTLNKYKSTLKEKNINTNVKIICSNFIVLGDEFRIEQVITNFITNAIKYTPSGENVNIILEERENTIMFSIENTGIHIPDESIDKIWHQFYRLDKSRSRAMGSSGLGLSIVKNILTQHESNFGVLNSPKGVLFYFDLKKVK